MILHGDCLVVLRDVSSNCVDAVVTDPPAGIGFMNKEWDKDKGGRDQWVAWLRDIMIEVNRVLKPGGHGFVWALPRTSHWTATALEDAGFEVRDVCVHLFGSGFPKSHDISKAIDKAAGAEREVVGKNPNHRGESQIKNEFTKGLGQDGSLTAPATEEAKRWKGFGTALKPASEHWILIRKPLEKGLTIAENVLKHGTGGLNIDATRIATGDDLNGGAYRGERTSENSTFKGMDGTGVPYQAPLGRFPSNVLLNEEAAQMLDEQSGTLRARGNKTAKQHVGDYEASSYKFGNIETGFAGDSGGASRFFYIAKASKKERGSFNNHPTVKSLKLMEYLITLITPPGGIVLDPFAGSGTTLVAAKKLGFGYVGIEREREYCEISEKRLEAVS